MLATRIIPTLLCRGRQLVKGKQFKSWRSVGVAAQAVRVYQQRGGDELVLIDIDATPNGRGPDLDLIEELAEICFMPLAVGGGITTLEQVKDVLRAGADKVVIGNGLWKDPYLATKIADSVGSQALMAAVDHSAKHVALNAGTVVRDGLTERKQIDAVNVAMLYRDLGAGEIMLTSVANEGMMGGYDLDVIELTSRIVDIPVIAHGGAGSPNHMLQAVQAGASAVAAGSLFQFTDWTPKKVAQYLHEQAVEVRIT